MNKRTETILKLSGLAVAAILLSGCGKVTFDGPITAPASSWKVSAATSASTADPDYNCPSSANVLPDSDIWHDGTMQFTACAAKANNQDLLVHGRAPSSAPLCVYPAQVVDSQHVYLKPDLATGGPWSKCADAASGGIKLTFEGVSYNAVFIVPQTDQAQMTRCLIGGNYYACPNYSYGQFR